MLFNRRLTNYTLMTMLITAFMLMLSACSGSPSVTPKEGENQGQDIQAPAENSSDSKKEEEPLKNLVKGKKVVANIIAGPKFPAESIVDGYMETRYQPYNLDEHRQNKRNTFTIDLEELTTFNEAVVYFGLNGEANFNRLESFIVEYSNDGGTTWQEAGRATGDLQVKEIPQIALNDNFELSLSFGAVTGDQVRAVFEFKDRSDPILMPNIFTVFEFELYHKAD